MWEKIVAEIGTEPLPEHFGNTPEGIEEFEKANDAYRRLISKTNEFKVFSEIRIEKTQRASSLIGNQYTGSIFLALMSSMESDLSEGVEMEGERVGLCGYGSGAKAKIFEGIVQQGWKEISNNFNLFERLDERTPLDKDVYERLHRGSQKDSIVKPKAEFALIGVGGENVLEGQRKYAWIP